MILIIDDDAGVRSSLTFLLKHAGFQAEAVSGPKEAIAHLREQTPELVLMDMNFSMTTTGEEGLQLLRQVKVLYPDLPVSSMTFLVSRLIQEGSMATSRRPWAPVSMAL